MQVMRTAAVGAVVAVCGAVALGQPSGREVRLTVREGTSMAAALSPDGRTVAVDLLGALWTYDAAGGPARRLLDDGYDARLPAWAPDGKRLAFQAYHRDTWHVWIVNADGSGLQQITYGPVRRPRATLVARRHAAGVLLRSQRPLRHLDRHAGHRRGDASSPARPRTSRCRPGRRTAATSPSSPIAGARHLRRPVAGGAERRLAAEAAALRRRRPWTPDGTAVAYTAVDGAATRLMVGGKNIADAARGRVPVPRPVRRAERDPLHRRRRGEAPAGGRRRGAHGARSSAEVAFTRPAFTPKGRALRRRRAAAGARADASGDLARRHARRLRRARRPVAGLDPRRAGDAASV